MPPFHYIMVFNGLTKWRLLSWLRHVRRIHSSLVLQFSSWYRRTAYPIMVYICIHCSCYCVFSYQVFICIHTALQYIFCNSLFVSTFRDAVSMEYYTHIFCVSFLLLQPTLANVFQPQFLSCYFGGGLKQ